MVKIGRDHSWSSGPTSLLVQGHPRAHCTVSSPASSWVSEGDSTTSLSNLSQYMVKCGKWISWWVWHAVCCSWVWHRSRHCYLARNALLNSSAVDCQELKENWTKQKGIVPQYSLLADSLVLCIASEVLKDIFSLIRSRIAFLSKANPLFLCWQVLQYYENQSGLYLHITKYLSLGKYLLMHALSKQ